MDDNTFCEIKIEIGIDIDRIMDTHPDIRYPQEHLLGAIDAAFNHPLVGESGNAMFPNVHVFHILETEFDCQLHDPQFTNMLRQRLETFDSLVPFEYILSKIQIIESSDSHQPLTPWG